VDDFTERKPLPSPSERPDDASRGPGEVEVRAAIEALDLLIKALGPGAHVIRSVADGPRGLLHAAMAVQVWEGGLLFDRGAEVALVAVIAIASDPDSHGALVSRSCYAAVNGDVVRAWRITHDWPEPLTKAEVVDAYSTDTAFGGLAGLEQDANYEAGVPLTRPAEVRTRGADRSPE
jgi:hypothetical protein